MAQSTLSSGLTDDCMVHIGNGIHLHHRIADSLYLHQREGVCFLWDLFCEEKGGAVVGDESGLGKTVQVIALLSAMFGAGRISSVLIITPASTVPDWVKKFDLWEPEIDVWKYDGKTKRNRQRLKECSGVCITTYGIVSNNVDVFSEDHIWDYVILDEGHVIKNSSTKCAKAVEKLHSRNRLVLTSNPIMEDLQELWSSFHFALQGKLLGSWKSFEKEYVTPIMLARRNSVTELQLKTAKEATEKLEILLNPYFLRRVNITNVNETTQGQIPHRDLVVWLLCSETQSTLYNHVVKHYSETQSVSRDKSLFVILDTMKSICNDPNHLFTDDQLSKLGLDVPCRVESEVSSVKLAFVADLMNYFKTSKTVFFFSSRKMLNIVKDVLLSKEHQVCVIDGTVQLKNRVTTLARFATDESLSACLITTQVSLHGLSPIEAQQVVLYECSWSHSIDKRAIAQVHCTGNTLKVFRLVTCSTIEEYIYRRQTNVLDCDSNQRYWTCQDLNNLFEPKDLTKPEMHKNMLLDEITCIYPQGTVPSYIYGITDHHFVTECKNEVSQAMETSQLLATETQDVKASIEEDSDLVSSKPAAVKEDGDLVSCNTATTKEDDGDLVSSNTAVAKEDGDLFEPIGSSTMLDKVDGCIDSQQLTDEAGDTILVLYGINQELKFSPIHTEPLISFQNTSKPRLSFTITHQHCQKAAVDMDEEKKNDTFSNQSTDSPDLLFKDLPSTYLVSSLKKKWIELLQRTSSLEKNKRYAEACQCRSSAKRLEHRLLDEVRRTLADSGDYEAQGTPKLSNQ